MSWIQLLLILIGLPTMFVLIKIYTYAFYKGKFQAELDFFKEMLDDGQTKKEKS